MIEIQRYDQLGHADHGWLNARHHFSFANYYNPERMGFGVLRVINDDIIQAGTGFGTHPHRDMEIITYVRKGAITHKDNQGNKGRTEAGDVQVMSAGTGIFHSEYNLESEDTNLYQIWIEPNQLGVKSRWDAHSFPQTATEDELALLVSGDEDAPLFIHQDAKIYTGKLPKDAVIDHKIKHQAYVLVSDGKIEIDGQPVSKGDGAQVTDQSAVNIKAITAAEILLLDVPTAPQTTL